MQRFLVIRIPLQESDPPDIIRQVDTSVVRLSTLMDQRFENIELSIEEAERV